MSILNDFVSPTTEPTLEDKKRNFKGAVIGRSKTLLHQLINSRNELYNYFWGRSDLSTEDKADALGTDAVSLFTEDAILKAFVKSRLNVAGVSDDQIEQIIPGVPSGYSVTPQQDGSIEITQL